MTSPELFPLADAEPQPSANGSRVVRVCVPTPVDREFDYLLPQPLVEKVVRGSRVLVNFSGRTTNAFVVNADATTDLPLTKLKPVLEAPDEAPLLDEGMLKLTRWISQYYACGWGEAMQAVLPAVVRRRKAFRTVAVLRLAKDRVETLERVQILEAKAGDSPNSRLRKQAKVLRTLLDFDQDFRSVSLAEKLGFSASPINTLKREGWLSIEKVPLREEALITRVINPDPVPELTTEQEHALEKMQPAIRRDAFSCFLLKGVTGSGKTEVYLRLLEEALAAGKSGIVLVPEISLTPQTVRRFAGRFQDHTQISVLHSGMTDRERQTAWKAILEGTSRIVIGPRSAIFAPVHDLGLVIVDEEHENSYKQDNTPRYHAREVAVMRCFQQSAVCVLGSATPSLETTANALSGRYTLIEMKERVLERHLPRVIVVDMADECRHQKKLATISSRLVELTRKALEDGQQAVMFLNRRGYHTFYQCTNCRELMMCPNCDVPFALHRQQGKLVCHYCYETSDLKLTCPTCKSGEMRAQGMGTELLEEELKRLLPGARIARMDSDTMKDRDDYEETLNAFGEGEFDLLIGTQMIAKGLDFPNVTVVGVIHADLNLHMADFRAQERTFQLLTQVAGRAGRGAEAGTVIVQTFAPDHPCIQAAQNHDYWSFFEAEMAARKVANYPPYTRLVHVTIEARDEAKGRELAARIRAQMDDLRHRSSGAIVGMLGPATAPIAKIRGRHRTTFLIKVKDHNAMIRVADHLRDKVKSGENLRVSIDVDPYSMS